MGSTGSGATDMDYGQYYGFSRMPFGEDSDREIFFRSETHKEALAVTLYGIRKRQGYIVIFGDQGMGKTALIRQVMDHLDERTRVVLISQSHDEYFMFLKELMGKLGLRAKGVTKGSMLHELYEYLTECLRKGENIVVFLDDAHRMKNEIIEELRLMSNFETSETKLIQIVMAGEPELDRRLNSNHMRQIRQRIKILHRLLPLGHDESLQYIEHRLARAGGKQRRCLHARGAGVHLQLCRRDSPKHQCPLRPSPDPGGGAIRKTRVRRGRSSCPEKCGASDPADIPVACERTGRKFGPSIPLALCISGRRGVRGFSGKLLSEPYTRYCAHECRRPAGAEPKSFRRRRGGQGTVPDGIAAGRHAGRETGNPPCSPRRPDHGSGHAGAYRRGYPCQRCRRQGGETPRPSPPDITGLVNATVLDCILEANTEITDINFIKAGSRVMMPKDAEKAEARQAAGRIVRDSCRDVHKLPRSAEVCREHQLRSWQCRHCEKKRCTSEGLVPHPGGSFREQGRGPQGTPITGADNASIGRSRSAPRHFASAK